MPVVDLFARIGSTVDAVRAAHATDAVVYSTV